MATIGDGFQPGGFENVGFQTAFPLFVFGNVELHIDSQLPFQPVRACFIEETACEAVAKFFDTTGSPGVPSQLYYRVLERASQFLIADWTPISPSATTTILIPSADNAMVNSIAQAEAHEIQLKITDGLGNVMYRSTVWDIIRDVGLDITQVPVDTAAFQPIAFESLGFQTQPTDITAEGFQDNAFEEDPAFQGTQ